MKIFYLIALSAIALLARPARAATTFGGGTVRALEAEFMPGTVAFANTANSTACPQNPVYPGTEWLWFSSTNVDTNKAVYAAVLAAYLSGKSLWLTWTPRRASCRQFDQIEDGRRAPRIPPPFSPRFKG